MDKKKNSWWLVVGALGIVYGDIGTSPLYAMRAVLQNLSINFLDILGALSLVFWSLIIVISVKYLVLIFRADNEGEGGILALLALLRQKSPNYQRYFYLIGIFGAGLMLGDGMLTPAISVLSAVEGLTILSPKFQDFVIPFACIILAALFYIQSQGTDKVGRAFGPIIIIWFLTIGILGLIHILRHPMILEAVNPYYAFHFFQKNGWQGFWLLGEVFLVVTGGEALYADIGHFGKQPIRRSWFLLVLPCLLLNYFGQGAHLLDNPQDIINPFYMLAPTWFFIPLLIISTLATIIASQAVISATFSLTRQAVLLGFYPRLPILQTSEHFPGQVYIPQVNILLFLGTLTFIFIFQNSYNLAHAYGIAVNLTMLMVTLLVTFAAFYVWQWSLLKTCMVFSLFVTVDFAFFLANAHKLLSGAIVPIAFAIFVCTIMLSWNSGLQFLKKNFYKKRQDISKILKQLNYRSLNKLPHLTAIFLTDIYDRSGGGFLEFLKLSRTVPEQILIVSYTVFNKPHVKLKDRFILKQLAHNVHKLNLCYGFMDHLSIPRALAYLNTRKLLPYQLEVNKTTYFVEIPNVIASKEKRSLRFYWQEKLFAFLLRNYSSNLNISFYNLPLDRTVALGVYFMI